MSANDFIYDKLVDIMDGCGICFREKDIIGSTLKTNPILAHYFYNDLRDAILRSDGSQPHIDFLTERTKMYLERRYGLVVHCVEKEDSDFDIEVSDEDVAKFILG